MKASIVFLFVALSSFMKANAQETKPPEQYKVPAAYHFDYKVVYEVDREENKPPETMTYFFTKNGDYICMENSSGEKDNDMNFMVTTKDGLMITFGEEPIPKSPDQHRKVLKVMDMHSLMKGSGEAMAELAKNMPKKDNPDAQKKAPNDMDNFVKTGRTKQVFGYTAEEYSKHFTKDEKGKEHSGTMSVWYAKVDFDPEMMFSMGMGSLAGGGARSGMNQPHTNNMIGLGITQKNYLLVEMDVSETGGKSGTAMKVISIDKTDFNRSTNGYFIKNYAGLSMKEMMMKESEER